MFSYLDAPLSFTRPHQNHAFPFAVHHSRARLFLCFSSIIVEFLRGVVSIPADPGFDEKLSRAVLRVSTPDRLGNFVWEGGHHGHINQKCLRKEIVETLTSLVLLSAKNRHILFLLDKLSAASQYNFILGGPRQFWPQAR